MKTRLNFKKNTATFSNIQNESQLEIVLSAASKASCKTEQLDCSTKVIVSGTSDQMNAFVRAFNSQL
jgi:hypothetical protein